MTFVNDVCTKAMPVFLALAVSAPAASAPAASAPAAPAPAAPAPAAPETQLVVNEQEYFEMPGLDVMVFHDFYPEGHQGGVTIIQHGERVAANGDLRLAPAPGQWQPVPKVGARSVDRDRGRVSVALSYPDPARDRKGFNPIEYPEDLAFDYAINVTAARDGFKISVDLEKPLPDEWLGRVGFNLELFPGILLGKTYMMDEQAGVFPPQLNGPMITAPGGAHEIKPLAVGRRLVIAPENAYQRITITTENSELLLLDGRAHHNNGWFIVRTLVPARATTSAIEWTVSPHVRPGWIAPPVVHVSQVGYLPHQPKTAYIECDRRHTEPLVAEIKRLLPTGESETLLKTKPRHWGTFHRYRYFTLDFSAMREPGIYVVAYGDTLSEPFKIGADVFERHVWQPTLEYFLPVQMCHMRVNDRYRVWHGACHMDDAVMAPPNTLHFDGYRQGPTTLSRFQSLQPVPGLNVGGWHDAGDYDLRVESQIGTVRTLALAHEAFNVVYDETTVDQDSRVVELHRPDGKPDVLQQIEHGVLAVLAGHRSLDRPYRGIIVPTLRQYVHLGDAATMTDNRIGTQDDRWVFTEDNPRRELEVAGGLSAAARVLRGYDDALARECMEVAEALWKRSSESAGNDGVKIEALAELILATERQAYKDALIEMLPTIEAHVGETAWAVGRLLSVMPKSEFGEPLARAVEAYSATLDQKVGDNPFGVPIQPRVWGVGWDVQLFGLRHYYLHAAWPDLVPARHFLNALNYILGCHPGTNTSSFASGVGSRSLTVAYGVNRADRSYIPGGVASGTALIRPDFFELKEWPFLWQQTEYVVGGGASNFMFLALAAQRSSE
jgi:endoglucanase